jgi:hypothetical protein
MDLTRGQLEIDAAQHRAGRRIDLADAPDRQRCRSASCIDRHGDFFPRCQTKT